MPEMFETDYQQHIQALWEGVAQSDERKSSHWKKYTQHRQLSASQITGISGFGNAASQSSWRQALHTAFQRSMFGVSNPVFSSEAYASAKIYCDLQERTLDMDVLRHVFTLNFLKDHFSTGELPECVCAIGDGQANFVSAAYFQPSVSTIISVNLVDILINDLALIAKLPGITPQSIAVVTDENSLESALVDPQVRIVLLAAHKAELLRGQSIPLFVNIASFQEMTPAIVSEYFAIMRANRALHYCCNRVLKTLPGGEELSFFNYPWEDATLLVDELCPWHQSFYAFRWPVVRQYDGPTQHRLVQF